MLLDPTVTLTPFKYPQAIEYYKKQTQARWEPEDISYAIDVMQWADLDPAIKAVVAGVLRGFVQTELVVSDYWTHNITRWFPNPEIQRMAIRFGDMEGVHALSYNQLSETLGLDSYKAFKADPTACSKLEYLSAIPNETLPEIAKSIAIFSAFTEGVVLYSSFAILQWLKSISVLPGVVSVINYSVKDEHCHSEAGCWLFRTLLEEYPELNTPQLWADILAAANAVVEMEVSFIDSVFKDNTLSKFDPKDLKEFIKFRANTKLSELGSKDQIEYNTEASNRIAIPFDLNLHTQEDKDFFWSMPGNYSHGFELDTNSLEF